MAVRVLFAGGGTGGHVYPAIAIADAVRSLRPDAEISFVGVPGKIEARVVPARGYPLEYIHIEGLRRTLSWDTLAFPFRVARALREARVVLRKLRPDVVVGTGGYVCGPPVYMAARMGIPTLIQEQNSYPGITTRMLAPRVNEVHVTFAATRRFLRRQDNVHETGNPVRSAVGSVSREQGAAFFGLRTESTTLLVTGGSQGSASINAAVLKILPNIREQGLQVIWLTGEREFAGLNDRVREMSRGAGPVSIRLFGFLENMEYAFAAADIVLCRSGATTLAELLNAGLPSILVPYPFAAADHQTENAKTLAEHGAAVLLPDGEVRERLWEVLSTLVQDAPRRALMAERAQSLARPDAAQVLAKAVIARAEQRHG